jgi:hypothetical protein
MTAPAIDDFVVVVEYTVKELNAMLNMMNTPLQVPTTTWVAYINLIEQQAGPQVQKAQESLVAVTKAQNESKATS